MNKTATIQLRNLTIGYKGKVRPKIVAENICSDIYAGEIFGAGLTCFQTIFPVWTYSSKRAAAFLTFAQIRSATKPFSCSKRKRSTISFVKAALYNITPSER